jgi:anti-sigma regulatory factor (Ser/Thr protein kinase)
MPFTISVPNTIADQDIERFFKGWKWHDDVQDSGVIIDWTKCDFVAPWVPTIFSAYSLWLKNRGISVETWINEATVVGNHLRNIGYEEVVNGSLAEVNTNLRMLPITNILSSKDVAPAAKEVVRVLNVEDSEMRDAMKYSIIELLRNVVQHSRSQTGGVISAVYYPEKGMVEVTVADHGCGIKTALRGRYPEITTDQKAVKFALQPHVSGTFESGAYSSMMNNAGLGLFFIKEIVSRGGGGLFLASGDQMANIWGEIDGTARKKYIQSRESGWRGTFAILQLRCGMIEEFDSLLGICRDIAAEVRKDPTVQKLDFIENDPEIQEAVNVRVLDFEEDVDRASEVREKIIIPALQENGLVILHFDGIRAATQSFAHALMYRVIRDGRGVEKSLVISGADAATREAIRTVAAYAKVESKLD